MSRAPAAIYLTTAQLRVGDDVAQKGVLTVKEPHHDGTYYNLTFGRGYDARTFSTPASTLWLVRT